MTPSAYGDLVVYVQIVNFTFFHAKMFPIYSFDTVLHITSTYLKHLRQYYGTNIITTIQHTSPHQNKFWLVHLSISDGDRGIKRDIVLRWLQPNDYGIMAVGNAMIKTAASCLFLHSRWPSCLNRRLHWKLNENFDGG